MKLEEDNNILLNYIDILKATRNEDNPSYRELKETLAGNYQQQTHIRTNTEIPSGRPKIESMSSADLGGKVEVGYVSLPGALPSGRDTISKQVLDQFAQSIIKSAKESIVIPLGYTPGQIKNDPTLKAALERSIADGIVASINPSGPVGPGVRKDFVAHATLSTVMAASLREKLGSDWAFIISAAIGLLKEFIHDGLMNRGTPDYRYDLLADVLGSYWGAYGGINGVSQKSGIYMSVFLSKDPTRNALLLGYQWSTP